MQVNILGKEGAGKFNQANITREENKVIQAVFGSAPGDSLDSMVAAPDGSILVAGTLARTANLSIPTFPVERASGTAIVARISPDLRTMQTLFRLPPEFLTARSLAIASDGSVVVGGERDGGDLVVARLNRDLNALQWKKSVIGDRVVSVSVAPDDSVVVCPAEKPFVSRIKADGSGLIPFGSHETFRTDAGNPDIAKAWWEGCGYVAAGYKGGVNYHRGGSGGVQALKDGTFVLFTTNYLTHPGGGPDFDPMLLKFDGEGRILWCTNLLAGLPAESDQKNARLSVDPHTGDLLLAATQHGHFTHNLVSTSGAYLTPDNWFTGDIMIGWIARVDPETGKPKAATFYFPEMPVPRVAGKLRANSLFPQAPSADAEGRIYVTGATAPRLATTLHAFQAEALGGSGFVTVFDSSLSHLLYASLITARGLDFKGTAIIGTPAGSAVLASFRQSQQSSREFVGANADATNYLHPAPTQSAGTIIGFYPSAPWKKEQ